MRKKEVEIQEEIVLKHKGISLCWKECLNFKLGKEDNCPLAEANLNFDKKYGLITPVTECETYIKGE